MMPCASAQMLTCDSPWQWMCYNGQCIAQYDLCNGIAQCTDGSDEIDCNKRKWQDNGYMNVPGEGQMKSAVWSEVNKVSPTSGTTASLFPSVLFNEWLIAVVSILFIILLVVIALQCRRQRTGLARSNRAYGIKRGLNMGQNDGEDEDLLIGSLYS
ncbi:low-density lipoprotein receptor domain class A containing protein [Wuchereria bancrofti]|uniref:Low-density lipoprotein receptor domain class A containing protein n=2 Tax=Wuchereria bancrofti TaxID=6293 RepID=J9FIE5_WUCBA|nr:low-density lipoprotein receptor domain class A containing protein [Wuchereria bancrofti]